MALSDNLVNYYKFDETSGKLVNDATGSLNGSFRSSTVTTLDTVSANLTRASSKINNGINFPGDTSIVSSLTGTDTLAFGLATGVQKVAQSFVATGCGLIQNVRFKRKTRTGTPTGNVIARICADNSGSPGSSLAAKTTPVSDFNSLGLNECFISLNYVGTAGVTYWLTMEQSVNSDTAHENLTYNPAGTSGVLKSYDGASWSEVAGSLYFNIVTFDDIDLGGNVTLPYDAFSISFWLKTTDASRRQLIAQSRLASSGEIEIHSTTGATLVNSLAMENKSNNVTKSTGAVCTGLSDFGNWHNYTLTNGTTYWTVYQDGVKVYQTTALTDTVDQTYRYIGCSGNSPGGIYGTSFKGGLDELSFWDKELSAAEVLELYNSNLGTQYPFDFTIAVGVSGKGSVVKSPSQTTYIYGDSVTLTPTPTLGSHFSAWKGNLTGTTEVRTITVNQNYVTTSEFLEYTTLKSKTIYLNSVDVTKAKLKAISTSDDSYFIYGLSNDGGSTYEECSNDEDHTFLDSNGQEVKYQIWGKSPGKIISKILVKIN